MRSLIDALSRGLSTREALGAAYALSYADLQREWEEHLAGKGSPPLPAS